MSTLERRLTKLEDAFLTQPMQAFCLLAEPLTDANPEAWDEHRQQIEEAKARGDFVAIVSPVRQGERPHYDKGVTYFASEFEARLVEASMLPSERGNGSLLADVLKDATGNVIGPVAGDKAQTVGNPLFGNIAGLSAAADCCKSATYGKEDTPQQTGIVTA